MQVEIVRALHADQQRLENLFELYVYDFSEIFGEGPGEDGRFRYPPLDSYWSDPGRIPYLIRANGQLAGFALVARGSRVSGGSDTLDVAEFFVVRGLRRHGVGAAAAHAVFASQPGTWEVRVMDRNVGADHFWERAVSSYTDGRFESFMWPAPRGGSWRVFRFIS